MPEERWVSFEDACGRLKITADQLRRLVSEGEIRCYVGPHDTRRFTEDEVSRLERDAYRSAADSEYFNFETALRELQITPDQLKRLVSEGEIRAVRGEHNVMRFRKDEIERLKLDTGKPLSFADPDDGTEDLLLDPDDLLQEEPETVPVEESVREQRSGKGLYILLAALVIVIIISAANC